MRLHKKYTLRKSIWMRELAEHWSLSQTSQAPLWNGTVPRTKKSYEASQKTAYQVALTDRVPAKLCATCCNRLQQSATHCNAQSPHTGWCRIMGSLIFAKKNPCKTPHSTDTEASHLSLSPVFSYCKSLSANELQNSRLMCGKRLKF